MAIKCRLSLTVLLLTAGCWLVPSIALADGGITYTVTAGPPGTQGYLYSSSGGDLNGQYAPWTFTGSQNDDIVDVPSGFTAGNNNGKYATYTVYANETNITVNVAPGASIESNSHGDPTFFIDYNGSITLNITGGSAISTGQSPINDLFFATSLNPGNDATGVTINLSDSGADIGTMTGTIILSPYVSGSINLMGTGNIYTAFNPENGGGIQLGQLGVNADDGNPFKLQFYSTGTVTGPISVAGTVLSDRSTQINVSSKANVILPLAATVTDVNYFTIDGTLTANGAISGVDNSFTVDSTGTMNLNAELTGAGIVTNSGTFNIGAGGNLNISGDITNTGSIDLQSVTSVVNVNVNSTLSGAGTITNTGGVINIAGSFSPGTIASNSGTINIAGSFSPGTIASNSGTINIAGSFSPGTIASNSGTINIESGGSVTGNLSGTTGAILNIGHVTSPTFSMSGDVSGIPTINVNNSSMYTANAAVSGVTTLNVSSSTAYAIFNSTLAGSGSATITDSGSLTFTTANDFSGFTSATLTSGATLNFTDTSAASANEDYILGGMIITGASGNVGTVNITNASSMYSLTVTATSPIENLSALTLSSLPGTAKLTTSSTLQNINTLTIGENCELDLLQGSSVTNIGSLVVNGTLQIDPGATYTLSTSDNISGTGTITNDGQLTANGSFSFGGSFINESDGVFTIQGTPTLNFYGDTFINDGNLIANFTSGNKLPLITSGATQPLNAGVGLDLSHGTIQIGYTNNYIAQGQYTFFTADTPPNVGVYVLPQPNFYITNWQLVTEGNSLVVDVTRDGFGEHALTAEAQEIGNYLEEIGESGATQSQLDLLNALEKITNDEELTAALESLLPPQYTALVTLDLLDALWGGLEIRLASIHNGLSAGDDTADLLGFWVRPFHTTGTEAIHHNLQAYTNKNDGYIIGFDRQYSSALSLGIAGSYTKSSVTDSIAPTSITNIHTYMATVYGTLSSGNDTYVDALLSGGVSQYHGIRTIDFPGFLAYPSANYSSQQFSAKVMASKIWTISDLWQLTPWFLTQYSFVRQLPWVETGAGTYSISCDPDNINLLRFGVGAVLELPFTNGPFLSIPGVYGGIYVDAKGGADVTNSQFFDGGPIITNSAQQGRVMLKIGGSYELKINDNFEFIGAYDYIVRHGFKGTEAFLNLKYVF